MQRFDIKKTIVQRLRASKRAKAITKAIVPKRIIRHVVGGEYPRSTKALYPSSTELGQMKKDQKSLARKPLISLLVPTYNTNHRYLKECIESVVGQVYDNWQLCIVDDASTDAKVREIIKEYAEKDTRITYLFLSKNQHIAATTNHAFKLADGEFVGLLDHDDILWPNALHEVVKHINKDNNVDFIYTDEDHIQGRGNIHTSPFFKPDWNPDFLYSVNYITHFSIVRRTMFKKVGGLDARYNGAQDWDLFLKIASKTRRISHIPKVLYSWRIHDQSTSKSTDTKPYVVAAQKRAIMDALIRNGGNKDSISVVQDNKFPGYWQASFMVRSEPLISIVIPSKNQCDILRRCLDSVYDKSTYRNFEVIVVDTGSNEKAVNRLYARMRKTHSNFRVIDWPEQPFSYARACNKGAGVAKGEYLVMLNNDTEVITPNWLELMASDAQRSDVGAVGCKLYFPDGKHIQHAGVGIGLGGVAANLFSMTSVNDSLSKTQHLMLHTRHNVTAVTAACLMIKTKVFNEINGFDERYRVTYNDVDLCLRLHDSGLRNVYIPYVELIHHESISVGLPEEVEKRDTKEFKNAKRQFVAQWDTYIRHDPNININISRDYADFRTKTTI